MSRLQIERILAIDRRIRDGEYPNADTLAGELEVSRRVLFTDRKFLVERLGAPLAFDRARGGWHYTQKNWALPSAMVTQGELLAFFLAVEIARRNSGGAFEKPLLSAVEKIARALPAEVEVEWESLRAHCTFAGPSSASADESTLLMLHQAIERRREVEFGYHAFSTGQHATRQVQPYHLHNARGDWYLLAFDRSRRAMRTFHAGRIERPRLRDNFFVRDQPFDAQSWNREAFVTEISAQVQNIAIRFDEYQARYIRERTWHETQAIEEMPDGGAILRFHSSGLNEIKRWVMQYGAHAQVLEPLELRAAVRDEVTAMLGIYGGEHDE